MVNLLSEETSTFISVGSTADVFFRRFLKLPIERGGEDKLDSEVHLEFAQGTFYGVVETTTSAKSSR